MSEFRIQVVDWLPAGHGNQEDNATRVQLRIDAAGQCLSRNQNTWSRSVVDWVHVSAYPLAMWLAANWWRLCYEPARTGWANDLDWRMSHEMPSVGEGFLWPAISIHPDGESIVLQSRASDSHSNEPVQFLGAEDRCVPLTEFRDGLDRFITSVLARLQASNLRDTALERLWQEVLEERADTDQHLARRIEATLHADPDEGSESSVETVRSLTTEAGEEAALEVAAAIPDEDICESLRLLRTATGHDQALCIRWTSEANRLTERIQGLLSTIGVPPWQRGMRAARALRDSWSLGTAPLSTRVIEGNLGLPEAALAREFQASTSEPQAPPFGLAVQEDREIRIALRSRCAGTSRRFEIARLLGDVMAHPGERSWHPATRLRTARQKYQRAFAAELLAPVNGLTSLLENDRSDEALEEAAEHYRVSTITVMHQLHNHAPA